MQENATRAKQGGKRLELLAWTAAWDRRESSLLHVFDRSGCVSFGRYMLAAVMLKQLTFKQAVQHKTAVLKVASAAGAEGRTPLLGVFWDEVVRLKSFGPFC